MPKKAKKRRGWTKTDVRKLKALAKRKVRATNIASALKRSEERHGKKRSVWDCHSKPVPEP